MQSSKFDVFVGSETGLLKGVNSHDDTVENLTELKKVSRECEINVMCWNNSHQTEVALGRRNQVVEIYDAYEQTVTDTYDMSGESGSLRGLAIHQDSIISCSEAGEVIVMSKDHKVKEKFGVGPGINRMRQNPGQSFQIATGGKENDLKLWDINVPSEPVFKAKNVSNDWLNLRVPIWVTDIQFLGNNKIITSTGTHSVRIYDQSSNRRRPVMEVSYEEYPFTCLAVTNDENRVIVGNTKGQMALIDLRKKAMAHCYKGFAGSIRDVQCHPTEPIVASCGLDRFLRIHDINSRNMLHKIYLKSRLNCLLVTDDRGSSSKEVEVDEIVGEIKNETDGIWEELKPVNVRTKRKEKTSRQYLNDVIHKKIKL